MALNSLTIAGSRPRTELVAGGSMELDLRQTAAEIAQLPSDALKFQLKDRMSELDELMKKNKNKHTQLTSDLGKESDKVVTKYTSKEALKLNQAMAEFSGTMHKTTYVGRPETQTKEIVTTIKVAPANGNSNGMQKIVKLPFNKAMNDIVAQLKEVAAESKTLVDESNIIVELLPNLKEFAERVRHEVSKATARGEIQSQDDVMRVIDNLDEKAVPRTMKMLISKLDVKSLAAPITLTAKK